MTDFIKGKLKPTNQPIDIFEAEIPTKQLPLEFSSEAQAVFDAGRKLWKYYHT